MIKKISLIILLLLASPIVYGQEKEITKEEKVKEEKTFIGKGLAEIDNVATKAWKELLKLFKKRPFAYICFFIPWITWCKKKLFINFIVNL